MKIDGFNGRSFSVNKTHVLSARLGTNSVYNGNYENMIIGRDDSGNDRWNGFIYEILAFDRFLTDTEQGEIEWYLGQNGEFTERLHPMHMPLRQIPRMQASNTCWAE